MYIPEFWAGAICTLFTEFIISVILLLIVSYKNTKGKK